MFRSRRILLAPSFRASVVSVELEGMIAQFEKRLGFETLHPVYRETFIADDKPGDLEFGGQPRCDGLDVYKVAKWYCA